MEVFIADDHPFYFIFVDGKLYDKFMVLWNPITNGAPLKQSELFDIAAGYREALDGYKRSTEA